MVVSVTAGRGLVDDGRVEDREDGRSRPDPEVEPKAPRWSFSAAYKQCTTGRVGGGNLTRRRSQNRT